MEIFRLQDWKFFLYQDCLPSWLEKVGAGDLGQAYWERRKKQAKVWVNIESCKDLDRCPFQVLFHELGHVLMGDAGLDGSDIDDDPRHCVIDSISYLAAKAYLSGIKS